MDKKVFQKRLKRLTTCVLAIAVVACCGQNIGMFVQAAGTIVTLPITHKINDGLQMNLIGDYTTSVELDEDAYTAELVLPEVEMVSSGYVFDNWLLGISGGGAYNPGNNTVSWDSYMPASSILTYPKALPFTADYHIENKINVSYVIPEEYKNVAQVEANVQTEYLESEDGDSLYGKVAITLPKVVESEDTLIFVGWKCYETINKKAEIIMDGYEKNYCESGIDVYPRGANLEFAYPTDQDNQGGNSTSYVFEAQFTSVDKKVEISYACNPEDASDVDVEYVYQQNIEDDVIVITLPEGPNYENYEFLAWYCENQDGAAYEAGDVVELNLGDKISLSALWIDILHEGTVELFKDTIYKLAPDKNLKVNGEDTVYVGGNYFYVEESGTYTFTVQ